MHVFVLGSTNTAVAHPQSLLQAVGVGAKNSLPAAAGINWVLKDGLGRLGRLSVSTRFGTSFDSNLKVSLHSLDTGVGTEPPAHLGKHPAQMAFHHSPMCLKHLVLYKTGNARSCAPFLIAAPGCIRCARGHLLLKTTTICMHTAENQNACFSQPMPCQRYPVLF